MFAVLKRARKGWTQHIHRPLLGLFAAFALAACEPGAIGSSGPRVDTSAPVTVALLVPGGSGQAGNDLIARSLENAARLAVSDLQGVRIDLRVYSTAGQPEAAAAAASRAVADGARIILGPVYAEAAAAAGNAVAARGVSVLSFSNNAAVAGGNVFVLGPTFENTANRLLRYAALNDRGRVMVIHEETAEGRVGLEAIRAAAAQSGIALAATEGFAFSQQGVVDALPRLAETARNSGAQSIFFTANTAGALPLLTQLLPENRVGPDQFQFIGLTRWDIPAATLQLRGVQGGWFAMPDPALMAQFEARYETAYGTAPHPIAGLAYDGIAAIGALLSTGAPDALSRASLTRSAGFAGVSGVFRFNPNGTNTRGLAVATIQNNEVVILDPAPRSFAGPGF